MLHWGDDIPSNVATVNRFDELWITRPSWVRLFALANLGAEGTSML